MHTKTIFLGAQAVGSDAIGSVACGIENSGAFSSFVESNGFFLFYRDPFVFNSLWFCIWYVCSMCWSFLYVPPKFLFFYARSLSLSLDLWIVFFICFRLDFLFASIFYYMTFLCTVDAVQMQGQNNNNNRKCTTIKKNLPSSDFSWRNMCSRSSSFFDTYGSFFFWICVCFFLFISFAVYSCIILSFLAIVVDRRNHQWIYMMVK